MDDLLDVRDLKPSELRAIEKVEEDLYLLEKSYNEGKINPMVFEFTLTSLEYYLSQHIDLKVRFSRVENALKRINDLVAWYYTGL